VGQERGFSDGAVSEAEEFDKNPKRPMMRTVTESQLSRGILSYCKGYCGRVERGTSRGSKEERIRIHLQVWANIRNNGYKR